MNYNEKPLTFEEIQESREILKHYLDLTSKDPGSRKNFVHTQLSQVLDDFSNNIHNILESYDKRLFSQIKRNPFNTDSFIRKENSKANPQFRQVYAYLRESTRSFF